MDARPNPLPDHEDLVIDHSDTDDSQIIRLPTVAGLLYDTSEAESSASPDLWAALADAVMSERAFDEFDAANDDNEGLAEVIDLNRWRG